MRVALLFSAQGPEIGGGHTFESDVLAGLIELAAASPHEFVLFSEGALPSAEALAPSIRSVRLPERAQFPPGETPSARKRRRRWRIVGRKIPKPAPIRPIDTILEREAIDFVWGVATHTPVFEVPYIANIWDLQHRLQPWFPEVSADGAWRERENLLGTTLRRAAFVLTGTEVGKAEITDFYDVHPDRVRVVPQPTPSFARRAAEQGELSVPAELGVPPDYLFYPAQFWPHKNHVNLLLALKHLRDDGLELPLVLTGSNQGNQDVVEHTVKRLGLEKQVHVLGFVAQDVLPALYAEARMLAFVSCFGPDNLPPLEAMALGCPVVANDVAGASEQLGDAALRTDCMDPKALADAIRHVHEDEGVRRGLVERGRERAARWTGVDYVRGVFELVEEFAPFVRTWRGAGPGAS